MLREVQKHKRFFVATIVALFASFAFNFFGSMSTPAFLLSFKDSEALVVNQIRCKGEPYTDQLLELKKPVNSDTQPVCKPNDLRPYSSQYGLQGKLYTFGYKITDKIFHIQVETYVAAAQLLTAFLSAVCFALLALWIRRHFNVFVANAFTILVALSPMVVGFARNLYWALPLMLLPFIYVLYMYRARASKKYQLGFWAGLASLFFLRYLCGYEYITTLTIMAAAGVFYYLYLDAPFKRANWKRYAQQTTLVLLVSIVGFAAAGGTHILTLQHSVGGVSNAIKIIKSRAEERTAHSDRYLKYPFSGLKANLPDFYLINNSYFDFDERSLHPSQLEATGVAYLNYAALPVINLPITLQQPFATYAQSLTVLVVVLSVLFARRKKWVAKAYEKQVLALFAGAIVGLAGFLSWLVLARPHSLVHAHINGILIYLPFALFAYMIIGLYLQTLVGEKPVGPLANIKKRVLKRVKK